MGFIQNWLRAIDGWQQRTAPVAFLYAVQKKFGDDRAGSLAALIAYYGFLSLFPLLLVAVTILGFVLAGNPALQHRLVNSALANFPIIGNQLTHQGQLGTGLRGNGVALAIGVLGLIWGSLGVAQQAQYAMAEVWHVPQVDRPNFPVRLVRALAFLGLLGMSAVVSTVLASAGSFGAKIPGFAQVVGPILSLLVNIGLYIAGFRILTPKQVPTRDLVPGGIIGGVGWFVLQILGGYLVGHNLQHSSQVYGLFGMVLGLIAWIYLGAQLSLYAAEVNVVRAYRLWPRSLIQPPLTRADRKVMAAMVDQEQRQPDQVIDVRFDGGGETGDGAEGAGPDARAPSGSGRGPQGGDGRT